MKADDDQFRWVEAQIAKRREAIAQNEQEIVELLTLLKLSQKYRDKEAALSNQLTTESTLKTVAASVAGQQRVTTKDRMISTAVEILSDGVQRGSRKLLAEFDKRGVPVPGQDPAMNLSSYLSHEKDIFLAAKSGWTLRSLLKARPSEGATSPGLITNGSDATHSAG